MKFPRIYPLLAALCLASPALAADPKAAGSENGTKVLKWADGKKACFLMAFDDGAPSQLLNVAPELEKRKLVGTFYLVTGNSLYANLKSKWERISKSPYIVYANHTYMHKGVNSVEELDQELTKCNEVLYAMFPERKLPRLLAYGQPGGVPWKVTKEEVKQQFEKHNLVDRPPFWGPPMHYKSSDELVGAVTTALAKGEMGHADFHGVGGDWLVTPIEWFTALLDKLEANREQVWVTDAAAWAKYVKERDTAEVQVVENGAEQIRINLTSQADPALYDQPLTLSTKVPTTWKACRVKQGTATGEVPVKDGAAQYAAVPGGGEIVLKAVH